MIPEEAPSFALSGCKHTPDPILAASIQSTDMAGPISLHRKEAHVHQGLLVPLNSGGTQVKCLLVLQGSSTARIIPSSPGIFTTYVLITFLPSAYRIQYFHTPVRWNG